MSPPTGDLDDLIDRAIAVGGPHTIKFTEACLREYVCNPKPLYLAAARDEITPPEVQYLMAQQIPNASLQTFEGVGHNMKVEIPDLLAGRVRDFVGKIASG